MNKKQNVWDILGKSSFNIHVKKDEIDPQAADNILIAWPPILKLILSKFTPNKKIRILDYGCSTGGFCNKLNKFGYKVTGVDTSEEMINTAKKNSPSEIKFIKGNHNIISSLGKFSIITTIMTLQFIENIERIHNILSDSVVDGGILIIADFNREWVKESLKMKIWFTKFDSIEKPEVGLKTFGNLRTKVFIRDSIKYDSLAAQNKMTKIFEINPIFNKEFIDKYPDYYPNNISEYLILGYQKSS
ncbi:MAG: Ubiquinone/menaquinone biosynthesis methyltransferase [Candidatus Roizmanbacteria bacterium GW2011_GWA2_32_13]|uniref:Ubiquinone/menaquinone biosynthesis methyltransferase n=1 Tax=Candidatus Roizmanbacteria bacterium GW2011_GWA2_32_13 TaxID=1618475 RepID=A0A0F9ZA88_9BACT|nr:MAG: Ubiquinone/menaquinone biosynthesis methyltransferase [Candidatus Roizmanbacteria bacterium GW2011_GWA2_32_13]